MKLLGVMSLQEDKQSIRELLENSGIQLFSEIAISGHTSATIQQFGWFTTDSDVGSYSTLCFAIISDEKASELMEEVARRFKEDTSGHPIRAFQVSVERMI